MSLINEALKKAQARQQSAPDAVFSAHGGAGGAAGSGQVGSSGPSTAGLVKMFAAMLVITLLVAAGISFMITRLATGGKSEPEAMEGVGAPYESVSGESPGSVVDGESTDSPQSSSIAGRVGETTRLAADRAAIVDGVSDSVVARANESEPAPPPPPEPPAAETASSQEVQRPRAGDERDTVTGRVRDYLERLEVRGISMANNRALIYDTQGRRTQSFQKGEWVQRDLQIRIFDITRDAVIFEDGRGTRYVKYF